MWRSCSNKPTFNIAVRALVEHVLRNGDLRSDFWDAVQAIEGIRAHQHVQKRRPAGYDAEVTVHGQVEHADFILTLGGRIDGVWRSAERVAVEEIKTTRMTFQALEAEPNTVHWGQAICYACLLARQEELERVEVQLTYVQPDSWQIKTFSRLMETAELEAFFEWVVSQYLDWMRHLVRWVAVRNESLQALEFPFDAYRPGQRALAVDVYRTIRDQTHLIAQAATGIGKTMAVLFPALKALGEQLVPKIVFLTARTTGRLVAQSALDLMRQKGLRVKAVTLTAKDKICFNPQQACLPEECPYAKGYFDRLNPALTDAFGLDAFTREVIETIARRHEVCPFEFSLELVNWADVVIGDYNYAFDPQVMLRRLFTDDGDKHAVLVDEAHNLVDRSREMFSAQLTKAPVLVMRRTLKNELPGLSRMLNRINSWLAAARRRCHENGGGMIEREVPQGLVELLRQFIAAAEKWLRLNLRTIFRDDLIALFFDFSSFLRIADQFNPCYATIMAAKDDDFSIKLFCIDPADQLRQAWDRCRAAVLFSATLTPADYFQSILGCRPDTRHLDLASPFPSENLLAFIAPRIATFYKQRANSSSSISRVMADLVSQHTGHYLFFFPSYEYMDMIRLRFVTDCQAVEIIVQSKEMSEDQREIFLNRFKEQPSTTLVGFAVMGGIFGEGIDLKGDFLTGAVIVGVGLPAICAERELIRAYFDQVNGEGFSFAYQYPGITRVLQAAGRVIRSEKDRGIVLLIDQRYAARSYARLLPPHWRLQQMGDRENFQQQLKDFWQTDPLPNT